MSGVALNDAAMATGAQVLAPQRFPSMLHVVTDTRSIAAGDTFLALRGERFDGHAFVRDALKKGAAAIVVDDPDVVPEGVPALLVADTKRAYMDLAAAARRNFGGHVVAITGSAGKTTTKQLLAQLLGMHFGDAHVLATPANENNEIGVSKLLLQATSQHRAIVVEMGARHEGEITELVSIAHPHAGILTNIGEAHLEIFGSQERLARTKWGLFSNGAQAVLNARDSESRRRAAALPAPPIWFGSGEPSMPGIWVRDERTLLVTQNERLQPFPIDCRLPGAHNRANLAAAVGGALLLGVPMEEIVAAIPALSLPEGRYESIEIRGGARVIYDAYNANASGMIAALDAFAAESARRRYAVLGSMAELGSEAPALHERVGAHAAQTRVDALLVGGDFATSLAAGAVAAGLPSDRIVTFGSNADAAAWLRDHAQAGDAVLLKGSRKYKMEEIVSALRSGSA
ncbi:MAG TPA: UDP-N-acetylmuramoyl-tripeptide--D-alanyl-D-alanine ligase [Candidatus Baltobacteraceae bacterium]|jgi:UDP-N-acetylmuramoyl-tripeptide--D-alanyl-D-alanine ligase|nr:UDP-N-acetylmuramoyl-tripeptide--D-alanyl-D-alanine ligase [Candidatus Baltobacteraceae bacterium]